MSIFKQCHSHLPKSCVHHVFVSDFRRTKYMSIYDGPHSITFTRKFIKICLYLSVGSPDEMWTDRHKYPFIHSCHSYQQNVAKYISVIYISDKCLQPSQNSCLFHKNHCICHIIKWELISDLRCNILCSISFYIRGASNWTGLFQDQVK